MFDANLLSRLPLLESVLMLWRVSADDDLLEAIFEAERGRSYEAKISLAQLVHLMTEAILNHGGSARQAMIHAAEQVKLPASQQAFYGKLRRLPFALSEALVEQGTARLRQVLPVTLTSPVPESLRDFTVVVHDGKAIKRLPKRLKATRGAAGGLLGGKALVSLRMGEGLISGMQTDADGYADEQAMLAEHLERVRAETAEAMLHILDRNFGHIHLLESLSSRPGDHFIVRRRKGGTFQADPSIPERRGTDEQGREFVEQWGTLSTRKPEQSIRVRLIRLERKDAETIELWTDLLDGDRWPGSDILAAYLERWGIERVFQQVTEVFGLEKLVGATPQVAVFQLAICLLWYNVIQVVKAYLAQGGQVAVKDVSGELVFRDVKRQMVAMSELGGIEAVAAAVPAARPIEEVRRRLLELLPMLWKPRWRRAQRWPPGSKTTPTTRPRDHSSAARLIERAKRGKGRADPSGAA